MERRENPDDLVKRVSLDGLETIARRVRTALDDEDKADVLALFYAAAYGPNGAEDVCITVTSAFAGRFRAAQDAIEGAIAARLRTVL